MNDLAEDVAWDLQPLVGGAGAPGVDHLLDEAMRIADELQQYRGRLAEIDSAGLSRLMRRLGDELDLVWRAANYAQLDFSTGTADPARGALLAKVDERATAITTQLLFVDLEWAALSDERVDELLADPQLDFCAHHLRALRRFRPHLLSEPEERVLAEKTVTGTSAWVRLFEELTSSITVDLPGESGPVPYEVALSRLQSPDRAVRQEAAAAFTEALAPGLRTRAYVYNTLLADKAVDDRLRSYPTWLASRNLANQASDASVAALIEAVVGRYELPRRWYRLKARLLGLDCLADYDRIASVVPPELVDRHAPILWDDARTLVLEAYASFSPALADTARGFFDGPFIDAPLRAHKQGGAFCSPAVPSLHPYVLLNYTGTRHDVLTLAHELGHGVHFTLARKQGIFHHTTALTVSETASVFGEAVTFARLLDAETDPTGRLALLAENLEGSIATVFRQIAMCRFEDRAHTARRTGGELSVEQLNDLWAESQRELLGDAVDVTEGYRSWWSYIPHFIHTPGYVYAYAFGQLLALSVYHRYLEEGASFVPRYLELLGAGGSDTPERLASIVGCDLGDPGFWDAGLDLVEQTLVLAEQAAAASGRI